jgi:Na+-translocating ferredoxin:NAD+ oxidoreductase subunit D
MEETNAGARTPLLHVSAPPHTRDRESVLSIMSSVLVALVPALIAAVIFFGSGILLLFAVCVVSAVGTEAVLCIAFNKTQTISDGSAAVTGLLLACTLPPSCPLWVGAIGAVFATGVVKMAFGGLGHSFVNPALAARAFLAASFPAAMTTWTAPFHGTLSGMTKGLDGIAAATPLAYFKSAIASGRYHPVDLQDALPNLFFGNTGGCAGEASALALFAGVVFLLYRGVIGFRIPFSFIGTVVLLFWLFNGAGGVLTSEALIVPAYQLLSGGLILGAFFMATDPVTSPVTPAGKIIYGMGCGVLTFVIRKFGGHPEGVCYAVLLMNAAAPLIDRYTKPRHLGREQSHE